jgi:hypothetical protein
MSRAFSYGGSWLEDARKLYAKRDKYPTSMRIVLHRIDVWWAERWVTLQPGQVRRLLDEQESFESVMRHPLQRP